MTDKFLLLIFFSSRLNFFFLKRFFFNFIFQLLVSYPSLEDHILFLDIHILSSLRYCWNLKNSCWKFRYKIRTHIRDDWKKNRYYNYFNIHIVNFSARQGNATSLSGIQIVNPMKHASVLWVQPTKFPSFYYQTSLVFTCL